MTFGFVERMVEELRAGDRLLHHGRLREVVTLHDVELDPSGTSGWPAHDRARYDVELDTHPDDQPRRRNDRLLLRPRDHVLVAVELDPLATKLIVYPSEA